MKIFDSLIENNDIKKTLGAAIYNSAFSHAYIIEGAPGTGKRTIARLAAAAIICKNRESGKLPCGVCSTCKKILNDNCVDVRLIEITKVEQARELKARLYDSTVECDYKIYIITDAQKMNIKAQNALLISLEEPPKNVVFFILTTDAGALLETIRSRAQILRTNRLSSHTIYDYIRKNRPDIKTDDEKLQSVIMASGGSLGYAMDMADAKSSDMILQKRSKALELTSALLTNDADAVAFISSFSTSTRDEIKEALTLSLDILGDLMALKRDRGATTYFFSSADDAEELISRYSLLKLTQVYDALCIALSDLNSNASSGAVLMSILISSVKKGK
jgi:DNA polymerase-3 subunit delta'